MRMFSSTSATLIPVRGNARATQRLEATVSESPGTERRARRVPMGDVARLAGVSTQTVSRVTNGHPSVLPETRDRVLAAMAELGYRPNAAARALRSGEFRAIGIVLFTLSTTGNVRTVEAITDWASAEDYAITLVPVRSRSREDVLSAVRRLGELAVDAVVLLLSAHLLDDAAIHLPADVHVVIVDSDAGDGYTVVDTDQVAGAHAAVEHLLDLGHATVHHLAGPEGSYAATSRATEWRAALESAGRPVPTLVRGDWSAASGYAAGRTLAQDPTCTAVFAANDEMAAGLLRAFAEAGRRVPEDVSVVGFDDIDLASQLQPPLTTIHQDFGEVGRRCVAAALAQVRAGTSTGGTDLVPTHLVVRSSTGPAPVLA